MNQQNHPHRKDNSPFYGIDAWYILKQFCIELKHYVGRNKTNSTPPFAATFCKLLFVAGV